MFEGSNIIFIGLAVNSDLNFQTVLGKEKKDDKRKFY